MKKSSSRVALRAGTLAAAATVTAAMALVGASPASATYWTYLSNNASGKCLEVPNGNGNDGAPVDQWDCWGGRQPEVARLPDE
ncbi:RICIN domain-containing protein [Streptomyces sp. NRRL WC-3742]|uniref:RICIN domain-containing protein n=1 Tax=Streptomyces sp. NRRL WC-3742 TaxID=1463934 RepID=UPI000D13F901|nr:RICIN domain-containing protein [Streptomyces sp. NRRL WC-3742]